MYESDLKDSVSCSRKWLFDFIARKTQLVSFDCLKSLVLLIRDFVSLMLNDLLGS